MYKEDQLFKVLLKYNFDLSRNEFNVPSYLEGHFNDFTNDIKRAATETNPLLGTEFCSLVLDHISSIKEICSRLVEIGRTSRNGQIKEAFEIAYSLFSSMEPYFNSSFSYDERDGHYYRFRRGDLRLKPGEDSKKKKAELFHIKDSKRNLIGAYRFSIPGFPCLYLTSGFELGWFESGMPKQFSYCRMHIKDSGENALRLIDISNRPFDFLRNMYGWIINAKDKKEELQKIHKYFLNYIITYPLAAACSMKVRDRGDKFIEEYVIPQMLLNWIREKGNYDGIRYRSSLNTTLVDGMGAVNVAFPVKKFRHDGLCESLTSRIAVSDITYLDINEEFKKTQQHLRDIEDFKNELRNRRIGGNYGGEYVIRIIDICETITVTYNSIINGNDLNDVMLHQIDCIADYIYTINECKDSIIKKCIEEVKQLDLGIDEGMLKDDISVDIDRFSVLVTKVIQKHAVFHFTHEDAVNFEKI